MLLLLTGMQIREASNLRWEDVDLETGNIWIGRDPKRPEANTENMALPLSDVVWQLLIDRYAHDDADAWVFPSHSGTTAIMCPYRSIARVGTICGVYFKPHDLRRTFINLTKTIDVQPAEVETLLNHVPGFESASVYDIAVGKERLRPEPASKF